MLGGEGGEKRERVFNALSKVFQLFYSNISQIHVSWTIFKQYLTSLLS